MVVQHQPPRTKISQKLIDQTQLFEPMPEQAMTAREKRVMEAHRLRYEENLSNKEIADVMGLSESTIGDYFTESESDKFKRFYSDRELFELQREIESEVRDGKKLANNLLARAIQNDDVTPRDMIKATKMAQAIPENHIKMLQRLGVLPKQADKVEDVGGGPAEVSVSFEEVEGDGDVEELSAE
jgi:predicted transcriptional regulator